MNAHTTAWGLVCTSIVASFAVSPEVGLFLAIAAGLVALIAAIDAAPRRDSQRRNHARRR